MEYGIVKNHKEDGWTQNFVYNFERRLGQIQFRQDKLYIAITLN